MKNPKNLELVISKAESEIIPSLDDSIKIKSYTTNGDTEKKPEDVKTKGEDEPPELSPVSFFKMFQYSTGWERFLLFIGIVGGIITGLCQPANTLIFGTLTGAMVTSATEAAIAEAMNTTVTSSTLMDAVQTFAIGNSILGAIMMVFSYISIVLFNYVAQRQIFRIRDMFIRSALYQDIAWYDLTQSGDIASRLAEDITKFEDGIGEKVVMFVHNIGALVGCFALALIKGWKLALVCMISMPVTMIVIGSVAKITSTFAGREMQAYGKAGSIAEEVLSAIRTVVAFGGQRLEIERYKGNLTHAYKNNVKRGLFSGMGFGLLWLFIYSSYALSFWYGVTLVLEERYYPEDEQTYSVATMVTIFLGVMTGSMNLGTASPFIEAFGIAKAAAMKIFSVIQRESKINALSADGEKPTSIKGSIVFKNVAFEYPSRPDVKVLRGLDLSINKGETVALVGGSGCGKSTCIQLIQRFYDPREGQVLLDGHDLRDLNIQWLRSHIGVVGQEPVLFGTTIAENIRYGDVNATMEDIVRAAKESNAHDFIMKLPNRYETMVGERGAQISGGQKQRIAIARSLVRSPQILLLDEATSALDTRSESIVQAALDKASKGRTTIIVAHRLSTIRGADKIIVLSNGVVVEQGDHHSLMALKGHYYALVTTQVTNVEESGNESAKIDDKKKNLDEDNEEITMNYASPDEEEILEEDISMTKILKFNSPEWPYIVVGCLTSILVGCSMPLFAILFGNILGVLSSTDDEEVRNETNKYCLLFVLAGIIIGVSTFSTIFMYGIAGERLTRRLRELSFDAMLRQEVAWFDKPSNGVGSLCAKLSGEAAAVQGATGQRVGTLIQSATTVLLGIGIAMYYQWKLGLVGMAFMPFILITTFMQGRVMGKEAFNYHKDLERATKIAVEAISNIRTVIGLGREETFRMAYLNAMEPSFELAKRNTHYRAIVFALARSILYFANAAVMYYGGYLIESGDLYYSSVFKVAQALIMGTVMVANTTAFAPNYQKGLIAAAKIFALLQRTPKILDPVYVPNENWNPEGKVGFKSVWFEYPTRPGVTVLKALNLEVESGKTIALIGSSGCGKSTVIQLLQRFYDPNEGVVELGDKNITSVTQASLRFQLGIVSQEPSLFARSISENIAYGDNEREIPMQEIVAAAKKANIHNFIISLPLGYDTKLGDRGTQLSGGQKQRVAIARALIRNPRILLLDEATSALDMESEKIVQAALDDAKEGRTCITIAHRLSTIQDADKICVLDRGVIVESGTHSELLKKKGLYYGLCILQGGQK